MRCRMPRWQALVIASVVTLFTACGGSTPFSGDTAPSALSESPQTSNTSATPSLPSVSAATAEVPSGPPIGTFTQPKDIIVTATRDATSGVSKVADTLADDQDVGWFTRYGPTTCLNNVPCWGQANIGYNGHMWWTYNKALTPNSATWQPYLDCPGNYQVSAYIPSNNATTLQAPYTIQHASGSSPKTVAQLNYSNQWAALGSFKFNKTGGSVTLSDKTGETAGTKKVGYDAMKWTWESASASLTVTSPNGGETWTKGSSGCVNVTWNSSGLSDNVRIHLYRYGSFVKGLNNNASNTGSYCVPKADFSNEQSGGGYTIGMSNVNASCDGTVSDFSNSSFTIADPVVTTPNLKPYTPSGWSNSLVVTSTNGGKTSGGTLTECGTTYISWAVENNGSANIPETFYTRLYLDGNTLNTWNTPGLNVGYYTSGDNWATTIPAGTHSLQLVTDYTGIVAESNEGDNTVTQTFTWNGCAPPPATITGTVTSGGSALGGAQVNALGPVSKTVSVDSNGNYTLTDLPSGTYDVKASKSGYFDQVKTVSASSGNTTVLPFSLTKIPAAGFYYSPNNIGVTMNSGALNGTQSFVVKNTGDATLTYVPAVNVNWASVQKNGATISGAQQSLAPGAQDTLAVIFNSNGITSSQSGAITISHNDGSQSAQSIFLGLGINAPPPQPPPPAEQPAPSTPVFQPSLYGQCPAQNACYADPVNTAIGNYLYHHTDLAIDARGPQLVFSRFYNSLDATSGPLGLGWTHSLNVQIIPASNGDAYVRWGDGRVDKYTWTGSGFTPPAGITATLIKGNYYVLSESDQTTWTFTGEGQLQTISDRHNNKLQLSHDSQKRLVTATNALGESLTFTYLSSMDSKLASVTDFTGRKVQFAYSGALLTQVTDVMGKTFGFTYDAGNRLIKITERDGKVIVTNNYDTNGRVIGQYDAFNNYSQFAYNTPAPGQTTITDPAGNKHVYAYDALYRLISRTSPAGDTIALLYNSQNLPVEITDATGRKSLSSYDNRGNLTSFTDAGGAKWQWAYDSLDRVTSHTTATGQVITYSYDSNGNLSQAATTADGVAHATTYSYLATGEISAITDPMGFTTSYGYTNKGELNVITNANAEATQLVYDTLHRAITVTNPLTHKWTYSYNAADDLIAVSTPLSKSSTYSYDARGQLISEVRPAGKISRVFDDAGRLVAVTTPAGTTTTTYNTINQPVSVTDPAGQKTTYTYNALGYLTGITDPTGKTTSFTYDAMGRLLTSKDSAGQTTSYTLDTAGRPQQIKNPVGNAITLSYNATGQITQATDPAGNNFQTIYDGMGRKTQVIDPLLRTITQQYDKNSRITQLTTPGATTMSWSYDKVGRILTQTSPSGTKQSFAYDAAGQLIAITDASNKKTSMTYDADGKITKTSFADGVERTLSYDDANRVTQIAAAGKVRSYTYDAAGRMASSIDSWGKGISYTYTASGQLDTLTYPGNKTVKYGYDAANRLVSVTDWLGGVIGYAYDAAGRLQQTSYPNGVKTTRSYDADSRVTSLVHKKSDGSVIFSQLISYDSRGNIVSIDTAPEPTAWMSETSTEYSSNKEDQYTKVGDELLGYDPVGQLISRQQSAASTAYTFDSRGRLTGVDASGAITSFAYGPEGERVQKTTSTQTVRYVVDTNTSLSRVLAELDASSMPTTYYIYGLGLAARAPATGNAIQYYHEDIQSNIAALTNSAATVTDTYSYHPFGKVLAKTGTTANPYQFAGWLGVENDGALLYMRARYYDPALGRFVSKDPIGILGGLNVYDYVGGNPMSYTDPNGLLPFLAIPGAAWLVGVLSSEAVVAATGVAIVTAPIMIPMTTESVSDAVEDPSPGNVIDAALNIASLLPLGNVGSIIKPFIFKNGKAIMKTEDVLINIANKANKIDVTGKTPSVAGTLKHSKAKEILKKEYPDMLSEVSYKDGIEVPYGTPGSKRIDAGIGTKANPTDAFDFKFGNKGVTQKDIDAYQKAIGKPITVKEIRPSPSPKPPSVKSSQSSLIYGLGSYFDPNEGEQSIK